MLKIRALRNKIYEFRFELLMASLLCVFILNILFPDNIYWGIAQATYLPVQLLAALVLFEFKPRILRVVLVFGVALLICRGMDVFFITNYKDELVLLYLCFFGTIMLEVFQQIYHAQMFTAKIVYAAVCGLLLIGYCGYFLFLAIEFHLPGSFIGLGPGDNSINDLFYFSYVTILTIGYGDITPKTWIAKNATVLVGFTGYVYSIVVIATIVGRAHRAPRVTAKKPSPNPVPMRPAAPLAGKRPPEA